MTSGKARTREWLLTFERGRAPLVASLMAGPAEMMDRRGPQCRAAATITGSFLLVTPRRQQRASVLPSSRHSRSHAAVRGASGTMFRDLPFGTSRARTGVNAGGKVKAARCTSRGSSGSPAAGAEPAPARSSRRGARPCETPPPTVASNTIPGAEGPPTWRRPVASRRRPVRSWKGDWLAFIECPMSGLIAGCVHRHDHRTHFVADLSNVVAASWSWRPMGERVIRAVEERFARSA
jgi:hypothetical protein